MGKKGKVIIILILAIISLGVFTGCQSKEPVNADTYKENATSLGYEIEDLTEEFTSQSSAILNCYLIDKDDLHVEYFQLDSNDTAKALFDANKQIVEGYKGSRSGETSETNSTYQKYTLTADDMYFVVEQVGDTLVYAYTDQDKTNDLNELLKELGY